MNVNVKTLFGLEDLLADELRTLGATGVRPSARVVSCEIDETTLYRIHLESRVALRVLLPLQEFKTKHENHLYKKMREIDWHRYMDLEDTFAINAVSSSKYLTHSQYVALKTKDAICDHWRDRTRGKRPDVDTARPDIRFNVHVGRDNLLTLAKDLTGESLHRRGYRAEQVEAPLNEVLAAGMLLHAGYDGSRPFVDPMCGSGTLVSEAALIALRRPPNWYRKDYAFMHSPKFDRANWEAVRAAAEANMLEKTPHVVAGYDKDFAAIKAAQANTYAAHLDGKVTLERQRLETLEAPTESGLIVMNPPYDERLQPGDINALYKMMGNRFKTAFQGWDAWVISSNKTALNRIGLRPSQKISLYNGALHCRYQHYELYAGSRRAPRTEVETSEDV